MAFTALRTTPRHNSKTDRALASSQNTIRSLRAKIRESGEQVQEVALTSAGAFGAPYLASKFLAKDPAGDPIMFGVPGELAIGGIALVVGMISESEPISNVGKGALYAGAARLGVNLAKKAG